MDLEITGEVYLWRGPAPHHFVAVPPEQCEMLHEVAAEVTYGWGMIPVTVRMGRATWPTSLWPKDGGYVVPLRKDARMRAGVELGDTVTITLVVDLRG
ncbi:MAG TPA: DUF1905 domain-containing protein [Actinomycetales bacterium]|jgi:hypothetical protein